MWLKYPLIATLFFFLALLQASFLPHFSIMGAAPSLVFILFFILVFNECLKHKFFHAEYYFALFLVVLGGIFLDIFSPFYFGLSIISLLGVYALVKTIIYFIREQQDSYFILYFVGIFSFCFFANVAFVNLVSNNFHFGKYLYIELAYNVALACTGFYIYKMIDNLVHRGKQLRLF
ncbi:MAG: hypothetical protein Q7S10_03075 [bacterium]|nr:hypothetical protein [bacterium]